MRNILITLLVSLQLMAFSQISLESTYDGSAGLSQIKENTLRFYNFNATSNQCIVFNEQHQEVKAINIFLTSTQTLSSITYLSENLFDLDEKLELIYTYSEWIEIDTIWYLFYNARIINEDGLILTELPGVQYTSITKSTNGSELMAWVYDFTISSYPIETMVYHVPGNYSAITESKSGEELMAWPNPCSQTIYLPLTDEAQEIRVYNEQGQLIDLVKTSNSESPIKYQVNNLSTGIYFYQTISEGREGRMNKFIIH